MKIPILITLIISFMFLCSPGLCQEYRSAAEYYSSGDIPPWMEEVDMKGRSRYLVPKGSIRRKFGSQFIIETPKEYTGRKVYEIEGRLDKIDENQKDFKEQLDEIGRAVKELKESIENMGQLTEVNNEGTEVNEDAVSPEVQGETLGVVKDEKLNDFFIFNRLNNAVIEKPSE